MVCSLTAKEQSTIIVIITGLLIVVHENGTVSIIIAYEINLCICSGPQLHVWLSF